MKRAVITGATSMLGLALIDECIKNNTNVIAVIREDSKKKDLIPLSSRISVIECDVSRFAELEIHDLAGADVFYHFAWEATQNKERNDVTAQCRNVAYTLDAVHLARRLGCKKFVGAGSQAEYGRVKGVISPDIKVSPDSAYGIAKYAAGRLAGILCEQLGMDFIWTRIFSTYGINDMPSTMIMYCIHSLLKGEKPILTKCEQQWDYLYCRDAAGAFYLLGDKGVNAKIYNIGSGKARPLHEYVDVIRNSVNPDLAVGIGERDYAPQQVMYLCADISGLQEDTGFVPSVLFEDGIKETIEWCKGRQK